MGQSRAAASGTKAPAPVSEAPPVASTGQPLTSASSASSALSAKLPVLSSRLDLNEVQIFTKVVDAGSFSAAARLLSLPKSTVSRKVASLEESLGGRLLQRTTRKLHLTEQGTAFYDRVRVAIAQVQDAADQVAETQDAARGHVRVTAPSDFAAAYMGAIAEAFRRLHPHVTFEMIATGRTVDLVGEGIDIAIRAGSLPDSSLIARPLFAEQWHLLASPAYLASRGEPTSLDALDDHDCVVFTGGNRNARWRLFGPEGETTKTVTAGAGIGLMPPFLCADDLPTGRLRRVLPAYHLRAGAIHLVYPSARHLPARVRVFRDFMLDWVKKQTWQGL